MSVASPMCCPLCRQPIAAAVRDPHVVIALLALTPHEERLVGYLADHFGQWKRCVDQIDAVYGDDPNGGPVNAAGSVHVTLHHLRAKLADTPLMIEGRMNGRGGNSGNRLVWRDAA